MADKNKYDYSDSYTTYMPEEARGGLLDQVRMQTDRAMGRRHVYLNKEEQKEYEQHQNKEMFEKLIAGLTPDEQYMMRVQYGYIPINEPDRTRNYDDIHWFAPDGMGLEQGMVRLPNGLNISFVRQFGNEETKLVAVYREKDGAMISPQQFQQLVNMEVNYHGDYDTETINQIISNIQKLDKHAHKPKENDNKETVLEQVSLNTDDVKEEVFDLPHMKDNLPPGVVARGIDEKDLSTNNTQTENHTKVEARGIGALGDSITWEEWKKMEQEAEKARQEREEKRKDPRQRTCDDIKWHWQERTSMQAGGSLDLPNGITLGFLQNGDGKHFDDIWIQMGTERLPFKEMFSLHIKEKTGKTIEELGGWTPKMVNKVLEGIQTWDMKALIQQRYKKGDLTEEQVTQIEAMIFNLPNNEKEEKTSSLDPEMQQRVMESNKKYMDTHYKDYNPFALNEDRTLQHPDWQQVYDAYQNLVFTDDNGKPLSPEEQQKTKETLLRTAFYAAEMQFVMDTDISKPKDVKYKEALYDALTVGIYATAYSSEMTSLDARKANGDKGMGSLAIDVVMHEGSRPIKQSAVINHAAVVNSVVEHKYNQIEKNQGGNQSGILSYLKDKIKAFDSYMSEKHPNTWNLTKRLANVMPRTIKNVAIYTAVGALAGPAGLGVLAVKSAYDSYTGLQEKARNENMSLKNYMKAHKGEAIQAFATSGLSIAMNAIGMGALGEQVAATVIPHLATATRVLAVAPNAIKAATHGMKAFLTKIGLRNDDIEKEKKLAKEALTQTAETALGMVLGAGINQAINGTTASAATPEPNVPEINNPEIGGEAAEHLGLNQIHDTDVNGNPLDPTIQQNITNAANSELSQLDQMVQKGEATVEFHHQQGVSSAVYQHENGTTIVSSDIGANPNGSLTITNEGHVTTEQTTFNLDGSITTSTTDNVDRVTYTETHDSAGNVIHQEFTNSETGQPIDMVDGFYKEGFTQAFETDINGNPLNQEVQQNISNTVEGLVEHLEQLKLEQNGASLYDADKGSSYYTCHIGDETYQIIRDDSFKCSGETTITHTNAAGEIQSVTLHPDGSITGDMKLYEQIQQHTNNQQVEVQQTVNTETSEVSTNDQQFWDNRADKFLGEETTNHLYERIESGEIKLPEGIESKEEFAYKLAMAMEQTPTYVTEALGTEWQTSAQLEAGISSMTPEQFAQLGDLMNSFDDRGKYLGIPQIVEYTSTNETQIQQDTQITTSEQMVETVEPIVQITKEQENASIQISTIPQPNIIDTLEQQYETASNEMKQEFNDWQTEVSQQFDKEVSAIKQQFEQDAAMMKQQYEQSVTEMEQQFMEDTANIAANLKEGQTLEVNSHKIQTQEHIVRGQVVEGDYNSQEDKLKISMNKDSVQVDTSHQQTQVSIRDKLNELSGRGSSNSTSHVSQTNHSYTPDNTYAQGMRQKLSGRS